MKNSTQNTQNQQVTVTVTTTKTTSNDKLWDVCSFCSDNNINTDNVEMIVLNGRNLEFSRMYNTKTKVTEITGLQTKW